MAWGFRLNAWYWCCYFLIFPLWFIQHQEGIITIVTFLILAGIMGIVIKMSGYPRQFRQDTVQELKERKEKFERRERIRETRKLNKWFHLVFLLVGIASLVGVAVFADRKVEIGGTLVSCLVLIWLFLIVIVKSTGHPSFLLRRKIN